jgi:hypothetical protein
MIEARQLMQIMQPDFQLLYLLPSPAAPRMPAASLDDYFLINLPADGTPNHHLAQPWRHLPAPLCVKHIGMLKPDASNIQAWIATVTPIVTFYSADNKLMEHAENNASAAPSRGSSCDFWHIPRRPHS